jgi:phage terminase small subunit
MTQRQRRFVREYLIDCNATRAAIQAGYSKKTADRIGSRLLRNVEVSEAVAKAEETRLDRLGITADRVLREIARLSFVDPRKFFNDDGTAKSISELDDDTAAALAGLEVLEKTGEDGSIVGTTKKFKLADKGANLERLGRHLGLFQRDAAPVSPLQVGNVTINVVYDEAPTRQDRVLDVEPQS